MINLYNASIPSFLHGLSNMSAILKKAEANAVERKIDPSVLLNCRLAPDMFPLTKQVQITSDIVKGYAARISGAEMPKFEDNEASFSDLQARINKTVTFLKSIKSDAVSGNEKKHIALKVGPNNLEFEGLDYLNYFVLPNFYFHISMTYAILRHNGVPLGKADFLGEIQKKRPIAA